MILIIINLISFITFLRHLLVKIVKHRISLSCHWLKRPIIDKWKDLSRLCLFDVTHLEKYKIFIKLHSILTWHLLILNKIALMSFIWVTASLQLCNFYFCWIVKTVYLQKKVQIRFFVQFMSSKKRWIFFPYLTMTLVFLML